jgi:hypothetical protein
VTGAPRRHAAWLAPPCAPALLALVYLTDGLGQLDGAGRVVDGRRAMVVGFGLFEEYFTGGPEAGRHGLPARAGYCIGYLVVGRLAELATYGAVARAPQS